jgi:hypothetical protein
VSVKSNRCILSLQFAAAVGATPEPVAGSERPVHLRGSRVLETGGRKANGATYIAETGGAARRVGGTAGGLGHGRRSQHDSQNRDDYNRFEGVQ